MRRSIAVLFLFWNLIVYSIAIQIPLIRNVTLFPISAAKNTVLCNQTCDECLCIAVLKHAALNCFPNSTCQLFFSVPLRYQLRPTPQANIYFSNRLLFNESQCCMPNMTQVIEKLQNGTWISVHINSSRRLLFDDH